MSEKKSIDINLQDVMETAQFMPKEENALKELSKIPIFVRETVIELVEDEARKNGADKVTHEFYKKIEEEYAPKDIDNIHY